MLILRSIYSSSLTNSSEIFCFQECPSSNPFYEGIELIASESTVYVIASESTIDTYGFIYNNSFDPRYPSLNLIQKDDDSGVNANFLFNMHLDKSIRYMC